MAKTDLQDISEQSNSLQKPVNSNNLLVWSFVAFVFLLVLLVYSLPGFLFCDADALADVEIGMSKEEVIRVAGQPQTNRDEYWSYMISFSTSVVIQFDSNDKVILISY